MTNSFLFQATLFLIFIFLVITGMIYAGTFLIPVLFGGLLSLLLLPLSNKIESKIKSRIAAIAITIILFIIAITVIIYFISSQVSNIVSDFDFIQSRLKIQVSTVQVLINKYFGMDEGEQLAWFNQQSNEWLKSGISYVQDFILGFGNFLFNLTLVIIYIFFFLLYRGRIKLFILALFKPEQHTMVLYIINKVKKLVLNYLMGLFIALSIVGTMNAAGLTALGIEHGIFLGYLAGFLNIIPYVGSLIGGALPIAMALIYKDSAWYAVGVLAVFSFNQFIDNNITTPTVVGGYVKVNSLVTIFAVTIGGMIWGISGMILFIPMLGIFKIFCDNINSLKPFSIILSDDEDKSGTSMKEKIAHFFSKKKKLTS